MKWALVSHSSASLQKYHLVEGTLKRATLKYNHQQQSIRICSEKNQRVFFIEKTGFWNNRTILKNEYGLETGHLSFDRGFHTGTLEVEGSKYHFIIQEHPRAELVIYENDPASPLLVCDLSASQPAVTFHNDETDHEQECLLLGLCWYLLPLPTRTSDVEYTTGLHTA